MIAIAKWERIDGFGNLLPKRKPPRLPDYGTISRKLRERTSREGKRALVATYSLRVAKSTRDLAEQEERFAFLDALAIAIAKQYSY
jgi:hypothetical protein